MSKSAENKKGVILLLDDLDVTRKKIMSATTDSEMLIKYDVENKPGISNLIDLYMSVTSKSREDIEKEFVGKNYGEFKRCVADEVCHVIGDIQNKYNEILNSDLLDKVLDDGIEFTRKIAKEKYELMKKRVGLLR
jgi:tryptophanyl-tRNA synthetase